MRTKNKLRHLLMAAMTVIAGHGFAQCDVVNHNGGATYYLGWNALANQILEVRNDANQPIEWYTDAIRRMYLQETAVPYTIGSFPSQVKDGCLLLSPDVDQFYTNGAPGPYSLLHLAAADHNSQSASFREWMNTGMTITGNADHSYIGQKETGLDTTDLVIHWSDNPGKSLKDRLRFLFTSGYTGASSGATSLEGLEALRLYPVSGSAVNMGVGDFYAGNLVDPAYVQEPSERLDMLSGRLRIRELPDNAPADSDYVVMVVDTTANPSGERGVVKWVPIGAIASATDCEWNMTPGAGAGVNDVWTAYGGLVDGCPDETEGVGIGTNNPGSKLDVETANFGDGIQVTNTSAMANVVGIRSEVTAGTATSVGLVSQVSSPGTQNIGAVAISGGATNQNIGIQASANGGSGSTGVGIVASGGSATNTALQATVNSAGDDNTGFNARVSDGTVSNKGVVADVSGSAPVHFGLELGVAGGTSANQGVRITAESPAPSVLNTGVRVIANTPNGTSAENRGR